MDKDFIAKHIDYVLKETNFPELGEKRVGKVRDTYVQGDKIFLVATDRYSAFDRNLALIPFKGQVLTQTSLFWFNETKDIVPNHVLDNPDPNVVIGRKCELIPIEVVVRGYITGVTNTSLWTHYSKGDRNFGSFTLPEGLVKNQKLDSPVITPTTKFEEHDRPLTDEEITEKNMVAEDVWNQVKEIALKLFARGQQVAAERGLILVDTKYEFGLDNNGQITLIDEIHTPDSSRYWYAASYAERFAQNQEPEYFDKEFLRIWFKEHSDPYKDKVLPQAPPELIAELSSRYIKIYEQITGREFQIDTSKSIEDRIKYNIDTYVAKSQ